MNYFMWLNIIDGIETSTMIEICEAACAIFELNKQFGEQFVVWMNYTS